MLSFAWIHIPLYFLCSFSKLLLLCLLFRTLQLYYCVYMHNIIMLCYTCIIITLFCCYVSKLAISAIRAHVPMCAITLHVISIHLTGTTVPTRILRSNTVANGSVRTCVVNVKPGDLKACMQCPCRMMTVSTNRFHVKCEQPPSQLQTPQELRTAVRSREHLLRTSWFSMQDPYKIVFVTQWPTRLTLPCFIGCPPDYAILRIQLV